MKGNSMFIANDIDGNRITIEEACNAIVYYCPICGAELIQKRGDKKVAHFAHRNGSLEHCDSWKYDMSDWHRDWQNKFPVDCQEVVVEYSNEKHRADILIGDTVVEFQHSPLRNAEFLERNRFYTAAGYRVIWLFDVIELVDKEAIVAEDNKIYQYSWKHPRTVFDSFSPDNDNNVILYLQFHDSSENEANSIIEHVRKQSLSFNGLFYTDGQPVTVTEFIDICNGKRGIGIYVEKAYETHYCGFELSDLYDSVIEYQWKNNWVCSCIDSGKRIPFENCQACKYSMIHYDTQNASKHPAVKCMYHGRCMFRFAEVYETWNADTDFVEQVEYNLEGKVISYKYWKAEERIVVDFNQLPLPTGKSLAILLKNSDAACIKARNLYTGKLFLVGNHNIFKTGHFKGVHGYYELNNGYGFSNERTPIAHWDKPQWIVEWEAPEKLSSRNDKTQTKNAHQPVLDLQKPKSNKVPRIEETVSELLEKERVKRKKADEEMERNWSSYRNQQIIAKNEETISVTRLPLKKKYEFTGKDLLGKRVHHSLLGLGTIVNISTKHRAIRIKFDNIDDATNFYFDDSMGTEIWLEEDFPKKK